MQPFLALAGCPERRVQYETLAVVCSNVRCCVLTVSCCVQTELVCENQANLTRRTSDTAMQVQRLAVRLLTVPTALRACVRGANQCPPTFVSRGPARELFRPAVDVRGVRAMAATSSAAVAPPMPPFHLAFPVNDLSAARDFYGRCAARLTTSACNTRNTGPNRSPLQSSQAAKGSAGLLIQGARPVRQRDHLADVKLPAASRQGARLQRGAIG